MSYWRTSWKAALGVFVAGAAAAFILEQVTKGEAHMEWLSNNWIVLALVLIVLVAFAAFGAGGRRGEHAPRPGGCCGSMERDKEPTP